MLAVLFFLVLLGLLLHNIREPFTIHIEGELPELPSIPNPISVIHAYTIQPVYESLVNMIPYKHHYRKFKRFLKNKL